MIDDMLKIDNFLKIDSSKWWAYKLKRSKKIVFDDQPCIMTVEYGIDVDFANRYNQTSHFSIVGDIVTSRGRWIAGGMLHDEIRRYFPELAYLLRWHLFGMHYEANAVHWLQVHFGLSKWGKDEQPKALDHFKATCVFGAASFDRKWLHRILYWSILEHVRSDPQELQQLTKKFLRARLPEVVAAYWRDMEAAGVIVPAGTPEPDEPEDLTNTFSKQYGITLTTLKIARRQEGAVAFDDWYAILHYDGKKLTLMYSLGEGHGGREPEVDEVLAAHIEEAASVDATLEDWADDFGYDLSDFVVRTGAVSVYSQMVETRKQLIDLFGQELFDEMVEALG